MGGSSKAMDYVVGGWQISNTTNWSSGLPWTPSIGECGSVTDTGPCRPNVGTGSLHTSVGPLDTIPITAEPSSRRCQPWPIRIPTRWRLEQMLACWHALRMGHSPCRTAARSATLGATATLGHGASTMTCRSRRFSRSPNGSRRKFLVNAFNLFNHPVYAFSANNGANTASIARTRHPIRQTERSPASRAERTCARSNLPCGSSSNQESESLSRRESIRLPLLFLLFHLVDASVQGYLAPPTALS